jgi:hypothetical protein
MAPLIAIGGALGVGGAGLGAGLAGASSGGGGGGYAAPAPAQSADSLIAASNEKAEDDRKELLRQRSARTILTGPRGVFEEADTAKKTLLGG